MRPCVCMCVCVLVTDAQLSAFYLTKVKVRDGGRDSGFFQRRESEKAERGRSLNCSQPLL